MSKEGQSVGPKEVAEILRRSKRILVVSHVSPDPDAYGSSCGLMLALRERGHSVACVNESPTPPWIGFLPGVSEVAQVVPNTSFDCVVIVDCGEKERVGDTLVTLLPQNVPVINIDHHVSNDRFGAYNYVVDTASSSSELVLKVIEAYGGPISAPVATCLYAGILTDTGSFVYSSVTAETYLVAARLISAGARPHLIAQKLFDERSIVSVRLEAEALQGLEIHHDGLVACVVVTAEMLRRHPCHIDETKVLVDRVRSLQGVRVGVYIREDDGLWKVSLRGKDGSVNLSEVAAQFGGGGHKAAAAFRWRRGLDELKRELFSALGVAVKATSGAV